MGVAERREALRTTLRTFTDRIMRMTAVFPGTRSVELTPDELAELERHDDMPETSVEAEQEAGDQTHPLVPRQEHGHPKL